MAAISDNWQNRAEVRPETAEDLDAVLRLFAGARSFMREKGNDVQWNSAYPGIKEALGDIESGEGFVVTVDGEVEAVFTFFKGKPEPTYAEIYDGDWLDNAPYGTVHRVASSGKYRGMADVIFSWCKTQADNIRGDTHEKNLPMQNVFKRNGFIRCGTVIMEDGTPRIAYHYIKK